MPKALPSTDPIRSAIGERLVQARKFRDLSQESIGERVGLSFQQIQKYERASNRIAADTLVRLARALQVPMAYFFEGLDDPSTAPIAPVTRAEQQMLEAMRALPAPVADGMVRTMQNLAAQMAKIPAQEDAA